MNFFSRMYYSIFGKTVSASEVFGKDRPVYTSNIPPEYMLRGVRNQHKRMTNATYASKKLRGDLNQLNKYDKAERQLLSISSHLIYSMYNYPYRWIPVLNEDEELVSEIQKLIENLMFFSEERVEFNWIPKKGYEKYLDFEFCDIEKEYIQKANQFLINETNKDLIVKSIKMDEDVLKEIDMLLKRIQRFSNVTAEEIAERLDFYGR